MRDFVNRFRWMDPFGDECCRSGIVDRGEGWHFPSEDGNPRFRCLQCATCEKLWFQDDGDKRRYTHRTSWIKQANLIAAALEERYGAKR